MSSGAVYERPPFLLPQTFPEKQNMAHVHRREKRPLCAICFSGNDLGRRNVTLSTHHRSKRANTWKLNGGVWREKVFVAISFHVLVRFEGDVQSVSDQTRPSGSRNLVSIGLTPFLSTSGQLTLVFLKLVPCLMEQMGETEKKSAASLFSVAAIDFLKSYAHRSIASTDKATQYKKRPLCVALKPLKRSRDLPIPQQNKTENRATKGKHMARFLFYFVEAMGRGATGGNAFNVSSPT